MKTENTAYCINKLEKFLDENKITKHYQMPILRSANCGNIEACIDNGVGWSGSNGGYCYWCFLQLKWIVTLIKDRENCGLDLANLVKLIDKYNGYVTNYGWMDFNKASYYNKAELLFKRSRYVYIYKKYCDYIKFHDEKFG